MKADETGSAPPGSMTDAATPADTKSPDRILIADDDKQVREMLSYRFRDDYRIETVDDGPACLDHCSTVADDAAPDLIILDVMMPGKDGLQVLDELRGMDRYRDTPVIMLTGSGQDETVTRSFEAGADDFTTKPLSLEELTARVDRLLDRDG
mgnify:CR=1 FL=1